MRIEKIGNKEWEITFMQKGDRDIVKTVGDVISSKYKKRYGLSPKVDAVICKAEVNYNGKLEYHCIADTNFGFSVPLDSLYICERESYFEPKVCMELIEATKIPEKIEEGLMQSTLEEF